VSKQAKRTTDRKTSVVEFKVAGPGSRFRIRVWGLRANITKFFFAVLCFSHEIPMIELLISVKMGFRYFLFEGV
jgi:hypothetical protein